MSDVGGELEAAISEAGMLLVWAEKYRHADPALVGEAHRRLVEHGDHARRLGHDGALESPAAHALLADVRRDSAGLHRSIRAVRAHTHYRHAVEAVTRRADGDLRALWPSIFTGMRRAPPPLAAFWTPVWQRRGRPLSADTLGAALSSLAEDGIPAMADDLTPGVDPELPGVLLAVTPPFGAPVALRFGAGALPTPALWLGDDQIVLPGGPLRLPFEIALAAEDEPLDEWVAEPASYLRALEAECRRRGFTVGQMPTPAASS